MKILATLSLAIICILQLSNSQGLCPEGWKPWKDEKCYFLVEEYANFDTAKRACETKEGLLANIKEEDQQKVLTNFIFVEKGVETGVWIGATRVSETDFRWEDGSEVEYTNWGEGSPTPVDGRNCVAMQSKFSKKLDIEGTWKDLSCSSPMYYVCETIPAWTEDQMRLVLIETRKKLNETDRVLAATREQLNETVRILATTKEELAATNRTQNNLLNNPVPIGFIYTQYPNQPLPSATWPAVRWEDVTSLYAGKFFRAYGGNSSNWGATQAQESPRLTGVKSGTNMGRQSSQITVPLGVWSNWVASGDESSNNSYDHLMFLVSNYENRPVNMAIRIWRRAS